MRTFSRSFPRTAPATKAGFGIGWRCLLGRPLQFLERLAVSRCAGGNGELSPEFFDYPPV